MTRIVGVNGIHTHGEGSIDLLLKEMQGRGFDTVDVRLPYRGALSARWGGAYDGMIVAGESEDGDVLVAHSYGCLRSWYAHKVREYKAIFCIAPAMSKYTEWQNPSRTWCYYSSADWVVRLGSWLFLHPFGAAGYEGFAQLDPIGHNCRMRSGHSGYFDEHAGLLKRIAAHVELIAGK